MFFRMLIFVFFFKQKTAYEMRISDWSSDVCSSDLGVVLPQPGDYAVAMCFMPRDENARTVAVEQFSRFVRNEGQVLLGWRDVPVNTDGLGQTVLEEMPVIRPAIVGRGDNVKHQEALERKLLATRKPIGRASCRGRECK